MVGKKELMLKLCVCCVKENIDGNKKATADSSSAVSTSKANTQVSNIILHNFLGCIPYFLNYEFIEFSNRFAYFKCLKTTLVLKDTNILCGVSKD